MLRSGGLERWLAEIPGKVAWKERQRGGMQRGSCKGREEGEKMGEVIGILGGFGKVNWGRISGETDQKT